MATKATRKRTGGKEWPRKVTLGRVSVTVYQRKGGYFVSNYASGKRRFDSYPTEDKALEAARQLVRQLSGRQVMAANLSDADAAAYAAAKQELAPFNVELLPAASTLAECFKLLHVDASTANLPSLLEAVRFYIARRRAVTRKRVVDVVAELLKVKENQIALASLQDLRHRLSRFATSFTKDTCDLTTAEIQHWIDELGLSSQSCQNFRRAIHGFFEFAVARGYATDNPVKGVQKIKVRNGNVEVFTPDEIRKLLTAASPDFLPCLAIGAFAGVRAEERQRLKWEDVRLAERHIIIGKDQAKTASRRIVPIFENLAAWLAPYAGQTGLIWQRSGIGHDKTQAKTAEAAGVGWKKNALRHSYASYRFAQTADAGRVAGECGNSAAVIHKHYRELVKPADAEKWFAVKPEGSLVNIVPMRSAQ